LNVAQSRTNPTLCYTQATPAHPLFPAPHGGDVVVLCHLSRKALFQLQERKIRKTADLIKKNYKLLQVFLKCIIFLFSSFQ